MEKISLFEATVPASSLCFLCSKKEAENFFAQAGYRGITQLCYTFDRNGQRNILWVNIDGQIIHFLPLFMRDLKMDDFHIVRIYPLTDDVMIYHEYAKDLGVCLMFLKEQNAVRQVRLLTDETMVENYCAIKGIKPEGISLCKICTIPENNCISVCWSVTYENPEELDDYGDIQKYETIIPVCLTDSDILAEHEINNLNTEFISDGKAFRLNGELFRALRDEEDKLFITKDLFSPIKKENNQKQKSACQIIALKPN